MAKPLDLNHIYANVLDAHIIPGIVRDIAYFENSASMLRCLHANRHGTQGHRAGRWERSSALLERRFSSPVTSLAYGRMGPEISLWIHLVWPSDHSDSRRYGAASGSYLPIEAGCCHRNRNRTWRRAYFLCLTSL